MFDMSEVPAWAWVIGAPVGFMAFRVLWPALRDSLTAQSGQWRMESAFIRQLSEELRIAKQERDEADRRADDLYRQLTELQAQMTVMSYKQKQAEQQIEALTRQLAQLMEANDDESDA